MNDSPYSASQHDDDGLDISRGVRDLQIVTGALMTGDVSRGP